MVSCSLNGQVLRRLDWRLERFNLDFGPEIIVLQGRDTSDSDTKDTELSPERQALERKSSQDESVSSSRDDKEGEEELEREEEDPEELKWREQFRREQDFQFSRIVSGTRLHLQPEVEAIPEATVQHLRAYVRQARQLGVITAIAVNSHVEQVKQVAAEAEPGLTLHVLHVPCWGAFVPALNALLNFAQRKGAKYILYQSLEVCCSRDVLQRVLDHHDSDTLVVGPVLDGHNFRPGEQILDGRSSPWNTLALWSVRKLALTGFLCIADGLPDVPPSMNREVGQSVLQTMDSFDEGDSGPMGSDSWWSGESVRPGFARQMTTQKAAVPAGVEEVTAIALLQHLHGSDRSRAVLLQLPQHLQEQTSWAANWGKDEARKKWHKYKMASKVARPAAQLQELFKFQSPTNMVGQPKPDTFAGEAPDCFQLLRRRRRANSSDDQEEDDSQKESAEPGHGPLHVGKVMHYAESIMPPKKIQWICLVLCFIFYANSTTVLSTAFSRMNAKGPGQLGREDVAFVALLMGGIYLPMPLSLGLIRTVAVRFGHRYGLLLFLFFLLLGHLLTVCGQAIAPQLMWPLVVARLVHGLGSGILFQTRHILAILSTNDNHTNIQTWIFFTSDLGLATGAFFPWILHCIFGCRGEAPELISSAVSLCLELVVMLWVGSVFPSRLVGLPEGVRFTDWTAKGRRLRRKLAESDRKFRLTVWLSGTMRIFVQSAVVPVVALSMRDANFTGNYRQTLAVASLFLMPLPFEVLAAGMSCPCGHRQPQDGTTVSKIISGAVGGAALLVAGLQPRSVDAEHGEFMTMLTRIFEIAILMIALGMAAPFNAAKLYQQKDAEHSIVILEWLKAYIGRLLGPFCAVLLYSFAGYGPVLG
ncbi:unnamed protein product, partial [Effrenium voratum]